MDVKLHDAELKVMEILWSEGDVSAKHIYQALKARYEYSRSTAYTLIKRCIEKGAIERCEPGFLCKALVTREQTQLAETQKLIDKLYGGAADQLVASILGSRSLSQQELDRLRKILDDWEE